MNTATSPPSVASLTSPFRARGIRHVNRTAGFLTAIEVVLERRRGPALVDTPAGTSGCTIWVSSYRAIGAWNERRPSICSASWTAPHVARVAQMGPYVLDDLLTGFVTVGPPNCLTGAS